MPAGWAENQNQPKYVAGSLKTAVLHRVSIRAQNVRPSGAGENARREGGESKSDKVRSGFTENHCPALRFHTSGYKK